MMNRLLPKCLLCGLVLAFAQSVLAQQPNPDRLLRENIDAVVSDYVHDFPVLSEAHGSRVLIDRYHNTIYATLPDEENGTLQMQDMLERDGFTLVDLVSPAGNQLNEADILIIHGLPSDEVSLPNGGVFWRSPISTEELENIVRFIDNGGGLYLSLSHWPNGSGALPILEALSVKFRDGYAWSADYPSFTDPEEGVCSHYFGMSTEDSTLNASHPVASGPLRVEKIDFLCGAAIFREEADVILPFPAGTINYSDGDYASETSDQYAGMIGFEYGQGKVVIATDQGMFRNYIFTFSDGTTNEDVAVTLSENNDNANLFINMMRWLSPKI